ncbi:Sir2 family NAD-dependent protein deacetylase [Saccharopolyspora halophila]|uniref:protein acetyllysine N-acetyltransferase n=1 Tax=Saccharopolyspora halophila TaxID=405551 RepID=A0ABP5TH96_9PSEU
MTQHGTGTEESAARQRARELFGAARRITALTGAGISTASGIPDFRGPDGVWTRNPEAARLSDIDSYLADESVREKAWRARAEHAAWRAEPNDAHRAFVDLDAAGRLRALLTQNIDELHQRAGLAADKVVELHGTMRRTICVDCGAPGLMLAALERVAAGETDPPCPSCGGIMKSAVVFFGEPLDTEVIRSARSAALDCDLFLAAGTSLSVHPAAGFAELATRAGARLIICNAEPTPYDDLADAVLRGPLAEVVPDLVAAPVSDSAEPLDTWGDPSTWKRM